MNNRLYKPAENLKWKVIMSRIKDMTKGSPSKLICTFALPLILGNLGQQFYMIVDTVIVSQGVGLDALAALGATDWTYCLFLWSVQALTQGFSVKITQKFGEKDYEGLRTAVHMSVLLCILMGGILTVLGVLLAKPLLLLMGTPEDIIQVSHSYLSLMCAGTFIVTAYNMASAILRSFGDSKTPLIAMGIAALLNICLDLLFVLGFKWGVMGAAAATLLAQLFSFLYCFKVIKAIPFLTSANRSADMPARSEITAQSTSSAQKKRGNVPVFIELCKLGFPLMLQHVTISIGGMVLQSVINGYGMVFVAGFTATNKLYGLLESSAIAFGFATSTYIAQNYGAGLYARLRTGLRKSVLLSLSVSVCISLIMIFFGKYILMLFISSKEVYFEEALSTAYGYLFIMSITLFILYLLHTYRNALIGLGNTVFPMLSGFVEFFMRVSIALFLPRFLGERSLFFAEPSAWAGCTLLLIAAYYVDIHKVKKLLSSRGNASLPNPESPS